ncbi:unnamed protein product [Thlaspi arvense]|uniref:Protein kinase domain-containing protein n=1 Tax=Thlaspi arvense TaxID=13288 RepID=A0AAU9SH37_THLAR|nr:unnamed protein product [Thlaspi arvense]
MDNFSADRKLPESMIKDFTRMILQGLVSIHRRGYVHCDLKSDNHLVFPSTRNSNSPYELKISDFGNSLRVGQVPDFWAIDFPFVGTPIYTPPESLRDGIANKTLDLWSLGCLVLEMYTGVIPWKGVGLDDLKTRLLDGKAPEIPESLPCDARSFIETCFSRKHEERGSAFELVYHRFLRREERVNSFLLRMKMRITRASSSKKSSRDVVVVSEKKKKKKALKFKFFPTKAPQFKTSLSKFLKMKIMPMKPFTGSSLVSVQ